MTNCCVCLCLAPATCHAHPATAVLSCFLELHLNSSCSPGTSHVPQSLEYITEASASLCFCHDCSLKSFLISCFGFRLGRCLSFPGLSTFFSYLGFPPCSLVYAPSSSSQLLTITCLCQHNSLACFQPFTFIPQHPCRWPSGSQLYLFLFSMWLWLTDQRSDFLLWMQLISQINAFHAAHLHLVISPPITAVCTARGQAASEMYGFPLAVWWNRNYHFQAVCISSPA